MNKFITKEIIERLWKETEVDPGNNIYAILDSARSDYIFPTIMDNQIPNRCLYTGHELIYLGRMPRVLASVVPYIVRLKPKAPFARWLLKDGWGDNWGIFLSSKSSLDELLRHFRRIIMVKDEAGKKFYFRFYDPRVFRPYLPTCSKQELSMIFGPVGRFFCEGENGESLIEYSLERGMLKTLDSNLHSFSTNSGAENF